MPPTRTALACWFVLTLAASARADEPKWKKHDINPSSVFEAAGVLDVDGDGKPDIVSGETWYKAPDWAPYPVRKVSRQGTYRNDFSNMPMDVNGDGRMDFITCSYFGRDLGWVENPGVKGKEWAYHEIDKPGNIEAAVLVDLDGDGKPDILPNSVNVVAWYSLETPGAKPVFKKHDFGTQAAGHGVGTGDMNQDGRLDILTPKGWFEAPSDPKSAEWAWHPDWNLGTTGIQILGRDVDGDGLVDLIHGEGHGIGLFWSKQGPKDAEGKPTWTKALIDDTVTSVHVLRWADLDGDGKENELISGKRVYAHEVEAGDVLAPVIAWYGFGPESRKWSRHVIYQGEAAANAPEEAGRRDAQKDFPAGTAGTGLEVSAVDIDGDGDIDLVCPGKSGLYLFENLTKTARP